MAVRYSGDAEVHIKYRLGRYEGSVRDPYFHWKGSAAPRLRFRMAPKTPAAYDDAAVSLLLAADAASKNRLLLQKENGAVKIRRLFQAPCPIGPMPRIGQLGSLGSLDKDVRKPRRNKARKRYRA